MPMPMQRTFTVIPTAAAPLQAQHVRPMTTKQVRKAYKASTKTLPASRAERIKQERAEQERIRRELEKEKAAAKARAAREKKREKEVKEREHRKRLGMPLLNVRPSQDTISRFARGNGSGKKRDVGGRALEGVGKVHDDAGEADNVEELRQDKSNFDKRELDLIPEEDESELEKLLDTITNSTSGREAQAKAAPKEDDATLSENHQPQPQTPPIKRSFTRPRTPLEDTRPRHRPYQTNPHPVYSPPPVLQQPPVSTQAILGNLNDFFPSSSQQALELQDETFGDVLGNELVALAVQRSKRTAALQELQKQEAAQARQTEDAPACTPPSYSKANTDFLVERTARVIMGNTCQRGDKEIISSLACGISGSQETEYGGDWVDELELDLIV
ncbi:hypothetical protein ED733_007933 [Metarhizium rileyi]|uniref:Uncharacterized protein n=1 Tax=Metarhizium rileyi (strain RCEF 4871) TaxID=1649241 RepID=A0A5C6GF71_METRR|nr:hypothetical protein ED733_007933 [Metarhizium rileyi]